MSKINAVNLYIRHGDKLTNRDICNNYSNIKFCVSLSYMLAAFAYWITAQNTNSYILELKPIIISINRYIVKELSHIYNIRYNDDIIYRITYSELRDVIKNEDKLAAIPEVLALNQMKPDFIDLGALGHNVFYMIVRLTICDGDYEIWLKG